MHTTALIVTTLALMSGPVEADRSDTTVVELQYSQAFLIYDVPAPAQESGLLSDVFVKVGDLVTRGQLLAKIDDRLPVLERETAERERVAALARAVDDIDVQFALKSFELAEEELQADYQINERAHGTVARSEVRRKELARHRAELQVSKSRLERRIARLMADAQQAAVDAATHRIDRRRIVSPFDGLVLDVPREANEWVSAGEPVVRVARLDRLRVDGFIEASLYDPHEVDGCRITVEVELARGRKEQFSGVVVSVTPLIQAGNRYRVRAEVENRLEQGSWVLQPGKSVRTFVHLKE